MKIINTKFTDLKIIKSSNFVDKRGYLREIFQKKKLKKELLFHYLAKSKKNVFRGFHFQIKNQQMKLVSVLEGKILDICVDLRKNSKTFGKSFKILLSEKNKKSILIPKGFAHGYLTLDKSNLVYFKNSNYRDKTQEKGILCEDIDLNIKLPIKNPLISQKDKLNMSLKQFLKKYKHL
tara:strand:- start:1155 stop:1688 length:534 start_codon:yes stop_codon:yes gene_type:complete